jgi:hypothetical protein
MVFMTIAMTAEVMASPQQPYSTSTLENALRAKVSMENFYENLLIQDRDRSNRWTKLEMSMEEMGLSNEEVRRVGKGVCLCSVLLRLWQEYVLCIVLYMACITS